MENIDGKWASKHSCECILYYEWELEIMYLQYIYNQYYCAVVYILIIYSNICWLRPATQVWVPIWPDGIFQWCSMTKYFYIYIITIYIYTQNIYFSIFDLFGYFSSCLSFFQILVIHCTFSSNIHSNSS